MAARDDTLRFHRVGGHFVARCEAIGVLSRTKLSNADVLQAIRSALSEHGVLIFPEQSAMTPEDEVALARAFDHDPTEEHPSVTARPFGRPWYEPWLKDVPEVRLVGSATLENHHGTSGRVHNGPSVGQEWAPEQRMWHQDGLADAEHAPPRVGTLRAIRVPTTGGETLFACTRRIARALLLDETRREQHPAVGAAGPLDPPASRARATYRRHASRQMPLDGVALVDASGAMGESTGPYPLIAVDEHGPHVVYNWNLESIVRPDGSRLGSHASWAYARALLEPHLPLGARGRALHTPVAGW